MTTRKRTFSPSLGLGLNP